MPPGAQQGPSATEIARMLNADAASLARLLFPAGKEYGGFFNIGSVEGEPGDSMKIRTRGLKQGAWADYSRDRGDREGTGDMLKLVQLTVGGGDIKEAIRWAKGYLGLDTMDTRKLQKVRDRARLAAERAEREAADETERKRLNAVGLWHHSDEGEGLPPHRYLEGRGIDFAALGGFPGAIRFRHDVYCAEASDKAGHTVKLPAMVSLYVGGRDAKPKGAHITYLALRGGAWGKAPLEAAKVTRSPAYWGAHIPLHKGNWRCTLRDVPAACEPFVSEGIEDGLTIAMANPQARVIAAGTLGNIGALLLPDAIRALTIVGQHDAIGGQADKSLESQIAAHQEAGRTVRCIWPDPAFKDFNDQLRGVRMGG